LIKRATHQEQLYNGEEYQEASKAREDGDRRALFCEVWETFLMDEEVRNKGQRGQVLYIFRSYWSKVWFPPRRKHFVCGVIKLSYSYGPPARSSKKTESKKNFPA